MFTVHEQSVMMKQLYNFIVGHNIKQQKSLYFLLPLPCLLFMHYCRYAWTHVICSYVFPTQLLILLHSVHCLFFLFFLPQSSHPKHFISYLKTMLWFGSKPTRPLDGIMAPYEFCNAQSLWCCRSEKPVSPV